jgi:hypothetical protein
MACYFWLDPKVTKRSSQDDRCHHTRQNSRPRTLTGHCASFLIVLILLNVCSVLDSSAEQLRVKAGKTDGLVRWKRASGILHSVGIV